MIFNYFISFCKANKTKIAILIFSIAVYFALSIILISLNRTLPELATLPFQKIGISVVVQKTGQIPAHMTGAIFPHSNGPIYANELKQLAALDFTQSQDSGLYFWYFGDQFFKTTLGVRQSKSTFAKLLQQNIESGKYNLSGENALVTANFAQKNNLSVGDNINFGSNKFQIAGILRSSLTGNIIPADIYINLDDARKIVLHSAEMQRIYKFKNQNFVNVVALEADPKWQGDKENVIKKLDKDYLVFSEKTFSKEVLKQIKLISSLGKVMFTVLGVILLIIFSLLISFNFKTREKEIAILRMIGWSLKDLQKQFMAESTILVIIALGLGNLLALGSLLILSQQQVSLELPWEISAKPHFLPQENAIDRTLTTNLPIHFNFGLLLLVSIIFLITLGALDYILFQRLKNIKPAQFLK